MADLNNTIVRGKLRVTEDINTNGNIVTNSLVTSVIESQSANLYINVSNNGIKNAASFGYSNPGGAIISFDGHLKINDGGSYSGKPTNQTAWDSVKYADYSNTGISVFVSNDSSQATCNLSFPGKTGTIAVTDDLSTLLDKGTSSTAVNQVIYNPVEMKKNLTLPSLSSTKTTIAENEVPGFSLGTATVGNHATSTLTLNGYPVGTTDIRDLSTTTIEQNDGYFQITTTININHPSSFGFSEDFGWNIDGDPILTMRDISTQQWKLTSTSGTVTTVNICTK